MTRYFSLFLCNGITSAAFMPCGNTPSFNELLKSSVRGGISESFRFFSNILEMLSCPLLLLLRNLPIMVLISEGQVGVINMDFGFSGIWVR